MNKLVFIFGFLFILIELTENRILNRIELFQTFNYSIESEYINLANQSIDSIDVLTFNGFNNLKVLRLDNNKLSKLENKLFAGLSQLKEVSLESNNLIQINNDVFVGLNNLELVCLSQNPISNIFPENIKNLCYSNSKCVLKINEKCNQDPLGII
jgi:Leucine-rich repeat (LRR) protein